MWNSHLELSISVAGRPASPGVLDVLKMKFLKIRKLDDDCLTPVVSSIFKLTSPVGTLVQIKPRKFKPSRLRFNRIMSCHSTFSPAANHHPLMGTFSDHARSLAFRSYLKDNIVN